MKNQIFIHISKNEITNKRLVRQAFECLKDGMGKHENIEGFFLLKGYDHHYINKDGRVYNDKSKTYLKTQVQNSGYTLVHINEFGKRYAKTVHRLVALQFIPNPENKNQVNHKDGNKSNNYLSNLEWVTQSENQRHADIIGLTEKRIESARKRMSVLGKKYSGTNTHYLLSKNKEISKAVIQLSKDGKYINEFESIKKAQRETKSYGIIKVLRGEYKQSGGFKWKLK